MLAELLNNLGDAFSGRDEIVAAYLFGSAAKGTARPGSDIDIALHLREGVEHPDRKALLDRLLPELSRRCRGDVHLLFLNDASYLARMEVFSSGLPLYVRDPLESARFRMTSAVMHADFSRYRLMTRKGLENKMNNVVP